MFWFFKCIKQYGDFAGRARRLEYWSFVLWLWIILGVVSLFCPGIRLLPANLIHLDFDLISLKNMGVIPFIITIFLICPYFAVATRRLHDINKSAWWLILNAIPVIGGIWFLFLMLTDGAYNDNQWGRNPKINIVDQR